MASTLADEYHGHQCMRSHQRTIANADVLTMALASPTDNAVGWLSETVEDMVADELYMAGEMTRAEWLLAKERKALRNAE